MAQSWPTLTTGLKRSAFFSGRPHERDSFIIVLARWLTLAVCSESCRFGYEGDVSAAADLPAAGGQHKTGAGRRLGRGGEPHDDGAEEGGRAGASDHPQRTLHGVVAALRAPLEERLRLWHCQQTDLSDISFRQGEHVAHLHWRFPH